MAVCRNQGCSWPLTIVTLHVPDLQININIVLIHAHGFVFVLAQWHFY